MKIKELMMKIRLSHIMCICIGVLIAIYCDVLFLHGFDSGTVSAIMDTVIAASALLAALSVRNWLKDKVKNKGFEHAKEILMDMHLITNLLFELQSNYKNFALNYMDGSELNKEFQKALEVEHSNLLVQCSSVRKKAVELLVSIFSLSSWDMKCNYQEEYIEYLRVLEDARELIEEKLSNLDIDGHTSRIIRKKTWIESKDEFEKIVKKCSADYRALNKRFVSAFSYTPPKE
ncbi:MULTISPECIES: hypothetical protein [Enterobacter]|uniref:hypothetical protein n=1 Tax=Enterobacter TaxID=547 RepID=UPI00075163F9|nr:MULTISPECIES: hypothetical protein [Enterobacter]AYA10951.1 hypothetical protein AM452_05520 [Enterobacter cloacae]KUQ17674.1 hypothetical protein AWI07_23160 [Enterobacter roggenkampii]MBW9446333.1 hypothetical protein [Enterobacter sp. EC_50]